MIITCIGYGVVGKIFAAALCESGAKVRCYDIAISPDNAGDGLRPIEPQSNIATGALPDVVAGADIVLSMVTTDVAEEAARNCAQHLETGQLYVDLNSTHPDTKLAIAKIVTAAGGVLVEGAVLGVVAATGKDTRILLSGEAAADVAATLKRYGLNCSAYRTEIGSASTFKMLRSVFSKGMEALLLETLLAARRAGIEEDIWAEICSTFSQVPFERMATAWLTTHAVACRRRRDEMHQVEQVVRDLGTPTAITAATTETFERSCDRHLDDAFNTAPDRIDAVLDALERLESRVRSG